MAFTESLLLLKKYFFRSLNGAFKPRKKGTFFTFKKSGGAHAPIAPPPRFRGPCILSLGGGDIHRQLFSSDNVMFVCTFVLTKFNK